MYFAVLLCDWISPNLKSAEIEVDSSIEVEEGKAWVQIGRDLSLLAFTWGS